MDPIETMLLGAVGILRCKLFSLGTLAWLVVAVAVLGSRLPSVFRRIIGESAAPQAREAFPSAGG